MSLREASKLSGVSHTHIRDIEDGRSVPSFEMVMKFLSAYGVAIEVFLRETGYSSSRGEPEGLGAARRVTKFLLFDTLNLKPPGDNRNHIRL